MGKRKKSLKKAQDNIPRKKPFPTRPPVDPALTPANPEHTRTDWGPVNPFENDHKISNVILDGPTPPPDDSINKPFIPTPPPGVKPIFTRGGQRVPGMYKHGGMHDGMDSIKPVRGISHKSFRK